MAQSPSNRSTGPALWFAIDARLAFPLAVVVLALTAWLASSLGVAGGLVAGGPITLVGPRFRSVLGPLVTIISTAAVAGTAAALLFGTGSGIGRGLLGCLAGLVTGLVLALTMMFRWLPCPNTTWAVGLTCA